MLFGHGIGGRVYGFATKEGYSDEGYVDWSRDADTGTDFDLTFNTRLTRPLMTIVPAKLEERCKPLLTIVAEIPG